MLTKALLKRLGREHGTPLFVVDHEALRGNYREFRRYLPRVLMVSEEVSCRSMA